MYIYIYIHIYIFTYLRVLDPSGPTYTWRGTAGRDIKESGRYYGKGMRIDYAMVSKFILRDV
jgi:exonuclease III